MTRLRPALLAAAVLALAGCSALGFGEERPGDVEALDLPEPETALDYEPDVVGEPSDEVAALMESSLALFRRREDGARSVAFLRRRAEGDLELARRILRSEGYYSGDASVEIDAPTETAPRTAPPTPAETAPEAPDRADPAAPTAEEEEAPPPGRLARVVVRLEPGPAYVLEEHVFVLPEDLAGPAPEIPAPADLGSPVGRRAAAGPILAAEQALRARLRAAGRPWARIEGRRAVADPETATLRVETRVSPGPFARFGPVAFEGLGRVDRAYVETWRPWSEGDPVSVGALSAWQKDLAETDLFSSVIVDIPEDPPPAGPDGTVRAPVRILAEEGPRRTVTAGLRADTEDGPLVRTGFTHRNLFGSGERIDLLGQAGAFDQRAEARFAKPQFRRPGQIFRAEAEIRNQQTDSFDELGFTLALGLERDLGPHWTVGAGGLFEISRINQRGGESDVQLFGLPLFAVYDDTDNPLDRRDGIFAQAHVTPFQGLTDEEPAPFLVLDGSFAAYRTVIPESDVVLAGRTRLASILAEGLSDVPRTRRLYAGGGGSVRGYASQMIGPLDSRNDPVGGRSAFELGAEIRAPIRGDIGGVAFVDAGAVSRDVAIDFGAGLQWAAGVGLRYYSPVGPIRIDVAFPLNPRKVDSAFAAYFSIGQAF